MVLLDNFPTVQSSDTKAGWFARFSSLYIYTLPIHFTIVNRLSLTKTLSLSLSKYNPNVLKKVSTQEIRTFTQMSLLKEWTFLFVLRIFGLVGLILIIHTLSMTGV